LLHLRTKDVGSCHRGAEDPRGRRTLLQLYRNPGGVAGCALQEPEGSTSKPKCFPIVCLSHADQRRRSSFKHTGTHKITHIERHTNTANTTTPNGRAHAAPDTLTSITHTHTHTHIHLRLEKLHPPVQKCLPELKLEDWILMYERKKAVIPRSAVCWPSLDLSTRFPASSRLCNKRWDMSACVLRSARTNSVFVDSIPHANLMTVPD